jgi:hypothetical protein
VQIKVSSRHAGFRRLRSAAETLSCRQKTPPPLLKQGHHSQIAVAALGCWRSRLLTHAYGSVSIRLERTVHARAGFTILYDVPPPSVVSSPSSSSLDSRTVAFAPSPCRLARSRWASSDLDYSRLRLFLRVLPAAIAIAPPVYRRHTPRLCPPRAWHTPSVRPLRKTFHCEPADIVTISNVRQEAVGIGLPP